MICQAQSLPAERCARFLAKPPSRCLDAALICGVPTARLGRNSGVQRVGRTWIGFVGAWLGAAAPEAESIDSSVATLITMTSLLNCELLTLRYGAEKGAFNTLASAHSDLANFAPVKNDLPGSSNSSQACMAPKAQRTTRRERWGCRAPVHVFFERAEVAIGHVDGVIKPRRGY